MAKEYKEKLSIVKKRMKYNRKDANSLTKNKSQNLISNPKSTKMKRILHHYSKLRNFDWIQSIKKQIKYYFFYLYIIDLINYH
jgi:hypothetical protein